MTVRAYDGRVYGTYEVTVLVEDVNEEPEFRSGSKTSFTYRENGTSALYTYRATDPEQGEVTWSLRGSDAVDFVISEAGVLTFASPPDFDTPAGSGTDGNEYLVTVVVTDDGTYGSEGQLFGVPLEATLDVTVTVTDLNEGPEIRETSTNTAITVRENHDQVLFTYSATDPEDPDAEITRWSVIGRDGGDFTINEAGKLTFRNPPDFERPADSNRDNTYEVTVRASDGRNYGTLNVTVTIEAVDEAPEFRKGSEDSFAYQENSASAIYTYQATDPEGSDVTWGLSGTDSNAFTISQTGVLTFNAPPDYENPTDSGSDNVYLVTVEVSDDQGNTARLAVTVTVTNLTDVRAIITGTAQVGQALTADTSDIADEDGLTDAVFAYQWLADGEEIEGATDSTYEVTDEDEGKALKVRVTFIDDAGNRETLTSVDTGLPAIIGTARVGETLTADTSGIADADGLRNAAFRYQWIRNDGTIDSDIRDSTGPTYTLEAADAGKTIKVRVSFRDDANNEETLTSAPTETVTFLIWAATLAAGNIETGPGYSSSQDTGTLSPGEFTVGVADYSVVLVVEDDSGLLTLGLDRQLGALFTLHVGADSFVSEDAESTASADGSGYTYLWEETDLDWSVGESVGLALTMTENALTALFDSFPESHDGTTEFAFELRFSEEFRLDYETLRDHAFTVEGGTVKGAERMDEPGNIRWLITVEPNSNADVTVVLPVTTDCTTHGSICTEDGRMLATPLELTITGQTD